MTFRIYIFLGSKVTSHGVRGARQLAGEYGYQGYKQVVRAMEFEVQDSLLEDEVGFLDWASTHQGESSCRKCCHHGCRPASLYC